MKICLPAFIPAVCASYRTWSVITFCMSAIAFFFTSMSKSSFRIPDIALQSSSDGNMKSCNCLALPLVLSWQMASSGKSVWYSPDSKACIALSSQVVLDDTSVVIAFSFSRCYSKKKYFKSFLTLYHLVGCATRKKSNRRFPSHESSMIFWSLTRCSDIPHRLYFTQIPNFITDLNFNRKLRDFCTVHFCTVHGNRGRFILWSSGPRIFSSCRGNLFLTKLSWFFGLYTSLDTFSNSSCCLCKIFQ